MVEKSSSLSFNGALVRFAVCGFNFSSPVVNPAMMLGRGRPLVCQSCRRTCRAVLWRCPAGHLPPEKAIDF